MTRPSSPRARTRSRAPEPAPPGRRERGKQEKLDRIRAAAHRLFASQGFDRTTTKQIAEAADIGSGTLFLYAPTKEDLLVLIFQDEVGRAVEAAFDSMPTASLLDQVMHVFDAITRNHAADPSLARVFVKELPFVDDARQGVAHFMVRMNAGLSELIERAKQRGEVATDVPASLLAQNLFGTYFQHLQIWLGARMAPLEPGDARLRAALDLQLRATRPASRGRRS